MFLKFIIYVRGGHFDHTLWALNNLAMPVWRNTIRETLRWENMEWIHTAQSRV